MSDIVMLQARESSDSLMKPYRMHKEACMWVQGMHQLLQGRR